MSPDPLQTEIRVPTPDDPATALAAVVALRRPAATLEVDVNRLRAAAAAAARAGV